MATGTRDKILKALRKNPDSTVRALGAATGIASPAVIHHHLSHLVMNGHIKKNPRWTVIQQRPRE